MTTVTLSDQQISAWLRGLLTIAWADGHFDPEEQDLITHLTQAELAPNTQLGALEPIEATELALALGADPETRENFLRTAVMVAIANGVYSEAEAKAVQTFHEALGLDIAALKTLEITLNAAELPQVKPAGSATGLEKPAETFDPLSPVRSWLDDMNVKDPRVARFICKMVPSQCPFERDITLFGRKVVHIPPMCKLNPLYDQLVGLRFRALSYLADDCGEDVRPYI